MSAPKPAKPLKGKKLDGEISRIYYARSAGRMINIFDIGKVFAAGERAAAAGESIEAAVCAAIETYAVAVGGAAPPCRFIA
jgi:hypothetical protein